MTDPVRLGGAGPRCRCPGEDGTGCRWPAEDGERCAHCRESCDPIWQLAEAPGHAPSVTYRDGPPVSYHGLDPAHRWMVANQRRVAVVEGRQWPAARPEECTRYELSGEWVTESLLVCPGCGLDCT